MPVKFQNFAYSFLNKNEKPVFVPTPKGYEVGHQLKELVERCTEFDDFYFHVKSGGHVAALHLHRNNEYFARIDLKNFFYSIPRNRVARVLYEIGIRKPTYYAKYSCVKNPFHSPNYALPYGFVQSPILATLILSKSVLGKFLREIHKDVTVSVYMDDVTISGTSTYELQPIFEEMCSKAEESNFRINPKKTTPPARSMQLFNCEITQNQTVVTQARKAKFYANSATAPAQEAFEKYCRSVEIGNIV